MNQSVAFPDLGLVIDRIGHDESLERKVFEVGHGDVREEA